MSDPIKGGGLLWHIGQGLSKNQWLEAEPKDGLPARIKQLDAATFACYRGGKYLGCEQNLEDAFKRIEANTLSEKNRIMAVWQRQHPDELPPGLQLTDAERAEYWRHNPVARPATGGSTKRNEAAATSPRAVAKEQPSASVPPRAAAKAKEPRGSARVDKAGIAKMLERGCTSEEVLKFTGWKAISMPAMAKSIGVGLRIDKSRKPFRYYSEKKGGK